MPLPAANLLGSETSPYLLQHQHQPIHWRPWSTHAFDEARELNRPVLLSVGYAACHWCHVMARESFDDVHIARLINANFTAIKVDREERPDLDQFYQDALAGTGQPGGWPLTLFLTPEREPFWGATYIPPKAWAGRPGLIDVLVAITKLWRQQPEVVRANAQVLLDGLEANPLGPPAPAPIDAEVLIQVGERFLAEIDWARGGLGDAPKFPHPPLFELLWRVWRRSAHPPYRQAVLTTLTHLCQGGIYDHLGGGFSRYATDPAWLVPHFEKMLYDNALLIELLTLVWQETAEPLWRLRVDETIAWVLREMTVEPEDGGSDFAFAAALDADSEHEEGKFYLWDEHEIDQALGGGPESTQFKAVYGVSARGNWLGRTILNRLGALSLLDEADEQRLAQVRQTLFTRRQQRVAPLRDHKVLADWNGLMIAALVRAAVAFEQPSWLAAARQAFAFCRERLTTVDGRLHHSWCQGLARHPAILDDYANLARAALALYEATSAEDYLTAALAWVAVLERHYADPRGGGYYLTADDTADIPRRARHAFDNATPSGNSTMAGVLVRLSLLTGDPRWRERAETIIGAFAHQLEHNLFPLPTLLNASDLYHHGLVVIVVGWAHDPATQALVRAARQVGNPNLLLLVLAPDQSLPPDHPAAGKGLIDGQPTAYPCHWQRCEAPVTDPAALAAVIARTEESR